MGEFEIVYESLEVNNVPKLIDSDLQYFKNLLVDIFPFTKKNVLKNDIVLECI